MRFKLILFLIFQILVSLSLAEAVSSYENCIVGVNVRDFVKYVGSFPHEEHEWISVSFDNISGSCVNISLSYDVRTPYKFRRRFVPFESALSGDVATGKGNIFPYVVPTDLDPSEAVPTSFFFPSLTINGTAWRDYAGQNRRVVFAVSSNMPWNETTILYWDCLTGVLVEVVAFVNSCPYSSMKAIETNLWSYSFVGMFLHQFPFLALLSFSLVVIVVLSFLFFRASKPLLNVRTQLYEPYRYLQSARQTLGSRVKLLVNYVWERIDAVYKGLSKALISVSLLFFISGMFSLTSERQWPFIFNFAVAVSFLLIGLAAHFEVWTGGSVGGKVGSFMAFVSLLVMTIAFLIGIYREAWASVPYTYVIGFGGHSSSVATATIIETVYITPYVAFASDLATIGLCLFFFGAFLKFRYGY